MTNTAREIKPWQSSNNQGNFITCTAFETFYSGGRGAGKSEALIMKFLCNVAKGYKDNYKGYIITRRLKGLDDLFNKAIRLSNQHFASVSYTVRPKRINFTTGESLDFVHLYAMTDYQNNLHGKEASFLGFDELGNWDDEELYLEAMGIVRAVKSETGQKVPLNVSSTANPQTKAHWAFERFLFNRKEGRIYTEQGTTKCYFKSTIFENKSLMEGSPEYVQRLKNIKSDSKRRAYLLGEWGEGEAHPFSNCFDTDIHVLEPFQIPPNWKVDLAFDWGASSPASLGWWAESDGSCYTDAQGNMHRTFRGDLFRIQEWYVADNRGKGLALNPWQVVAGMRERDKWRVTRCVSDFDLFHKGTGSYLLEPWIKERMYMKKCRKMEFTRIETLNIMKQMFYNVADGKGPRLFIFSDCKDCIRQLPRLRYKKLNMDCYGEDVESVNTDDHIYDEMRYRIMENINRSTVRNMELSFI